jgi:hypothetical protein
MPTGVSIPLLTRTCVPPAIGSAQTVPLPKFVQ